jgi:formate hydrogenlyase transcriptional activator
MMESGGRWVTATTGDGTPPHSTGATVSHVVPWPGGSDLVSGPEPAAAAERPAFGGFLDRLSGTLVECPVETIDAQLKALVGRVAEFFDVDHGALARPSSDGPLRIAHRWGRPGCAQLETFDPDASLPWITHRFAKGPVWLTRPADLPVEAEGDRAFLERIGIRSLASVPLFVGGVPLGWLMLGTVREHRSWSPLVTDQLRRIAEVTGSAVARAEADQAVRRAVSFDQAVTGLAASLIRVPVDTIDSQIVQTLGAVAKLLEADRASVIRHFPAERMLSRSHLWERTGTPNPWVSDPQDAFPWMLARLFEARKLIALTKVDELPPEAARDRASLTLHGVKSCALAPMVVQDRVVGIISFATVTRERSWPPDLMARLRLVGEIIASALARQDAELALRTALAENERLRERLSAENAYLHAELVDARDFGEIVGTSPALLATVEKVRQVADTTAPVLLLGETGTGKELLARAIHMHSRRHARSFVAVNCAALPAALIESELFGHERGAFTGASQAKPGRFELADHGTLLLDEIGDLEPALQAKLLRVLENGEIQRLGSTVTRKVDVRIMAATNRDLRREAQDGRFRSDLYYRLSVFPIQVPPLRDRRDDIPLLVWHFIQSRQRALNRTITKIPRAVMAMLQAYEWPGNVRELQNVIERAMILSQGPVLRVEETLGPTMSERDAGVRTRRGESLQDVERAHIVAILERCGWTIEGRGQAAEHLGLNPSTLRNRMRKLGITRPVR